MADSDRTADEIAARAYELADALLRRAVLEEGDEPLPQGWHDPAYDPAWDVEPRWSRADLAAARAERSSVAGGPGLASTRRSGAADDDGAREETA